MNHPVNKGSWIRKAAWALMPLCVILFGLFYYMFNIEPFSLQVETVLLQAHEGACLAQPEAQPFRIVQFSDTHFKKDFPVENMERIADEINALHPDLVIFTGDLYDNYSDYHDDEKLVSLLKAIQAPKGKLAIWGNRDYGGGGQKAYLPLLDQAGFTLLQNSNWYIPLDNGRTILFTGLDDALFGHPVMPYETRIYPSDYEVLVLHEPDGFENYASSYDLTIAGHTHGRQTGLPASIFPGLETKSAYWKGLYEVDGNLLSVNTGIGTTHISARFLMPPVLTLYEICF